MDSGPVLYPQGRPDTRFQILKRMRPIWVMESVEAEQGPPGKADLKRRSSPEGFVGRSATDLAILAIP